MRVQDLDTPAVTVHLDVMEATSAACRLTSRPRHGQPPAHQDAQDARHRQAADAGGAGGITCQKIGEVEVFADAGVADDVLLTYNILGRAKTDRLMAVARRVKRLAVVLDNEVVARGLSEAGARHGRDVPFRHRVRHRLRPQRGADATGRARAGAARR